MPGIYSTGNIASTVYAQLEKDLLLVELADCPVRLLSFFLKDLDLAVKALGLGASLSARTGLVLVGFDLRFELLDLALKH